MQLQKMVHFVVILCLFINSCQPAKEENKEKVSEGNLLTYSIKYTIPHDETAFTQGLVIKDDFLYESTGRDNSYIAQLDLNTGELIKKVNLENYYFGEGITIIENKLYQLTWTSNIGFIYELPSLTKIGKFYYDTEGWGLTTDGTHLIMSDGTDKLYYLDTLNFEKGKTLHVKENNIPVNKINELEYVDGFIYANQWETNFIYKIDAASGNVKGKINLTPLVNEIKRTNKDADVLNGIAYNENTGDFLITGKLWPKAYWINIKE